MQADLTARRWLGVPLVLAGAVERLEGCARAGSPPLARAALLTLAILADTDVGGRRVLDGDILPWLLDAVASVQPLSQQENGHNMKIESYL